MPIGKPDSSSFSNYGGQKRNYSDPEDVTTDYDATQLNVALCDVAGMTRTCPNGWIRFLLANTTGGITLLDWEATWKGVTSNVPTFLYDGYGTITITLYTPVLDENGVEHFVNIRRCSATLESGPGSVKVAPTTANTMTVTTYLSSTLTDLGVVCEVEFQ